VTEAPSIVVLAVTDAERSLVARAVTELVEREGSSPAARAVLEMVECPVEPGDVSRLNSTAGAEA
jgi:hypothetical protein